MKCATHALNHHACQLATYTTVAGGNLDGETTILVINALVTMCSDIGEKATEPPPRQSPFPVFQAPPGKQLQSSAEAVAF